MQQDLRLYDRLQKKWYLLDWRLATLPRYNQHQDHLTNQQSLSFHLSKIVRLVFADRRVGLYRICIVALFAITSSNVLRYKVHHPEL